MKSGASTLATCLQRPGSGGLGVFLSVLEPSEGFRV